MPGSWSSEFPDISTLSTIQSSNEMQSSGFSIQNWGTMKGPSCQCNINHNFLFVFTLEYPVKKKKLQFCNCWPFYFVGVVWSHNRHQA